MYLQMLNNVDEKLLPPVKQINEKYLWKWQKWHWKYYKFHFRVKIKKMKKILHVFIII